MEWLCLLFTYVYMIFEEYIYPGREYFGKLSFDYTDRWL